jgi:predicted phosphodiesterase
MATFQVLSDLHLELYPDFHINNVTAPYLILAGDIGIPTTTIYKDFIGDCSQLYTRVFIITGNHEYYGSSIDEIDTYLTKFCNTFTNVTFLNNSYYDITPKLRIIGTTLWSYIPTQNKAHIKFFIQDYSNIKNFTTEISNDKHNENTVWIAEQILYARESKKELIVVTHHAPLTTNTSDPKYANNSLNTAFATDLMDLLCYPIKLWIYGHTHYNNLQKIGSLILTCNQRGYIDDTTYFDPDKVFKI